MNNTRVSNLLVLLQTITNLLSEWSFLSYLRLTGHSGKKLTNYIRILLVICLKKWKLSILLSITRKNFNIFVKRRALITTCMSEGCAHVRVGIAQEVKVIHCLLKLRTICWLLRLSIKNNLMSF